MGKNPSSKARYDKRGNLLEVKVREEFTFDVIYSSSVMQTDRKGMEKLQLELEKCGFMFKQTKKPLKPEVGWF
jgi:hypothetical protein